MRSLYMIVCFTLFLAGCGGGNMASATYKGDKVSVTTDSTGKAVVTSTTLGIDCNIYSVDSSGNPVTGITVEYSEYCGKSVVCVKDAAKVYSNIVLISTRSELSAKSVK